MINVVNKHTHQPQKGQRDFYIGRGSPLGNPFTSKPLANTKAQYQCTTPEESVAQFRIHIMNCIAAKDDKICGMLRWIRKLHQDGVIINLVCFCKPWHICHGDVIKEIVESTEIDF